AALTGHLVLTTLHAKDAIGTIDRLLELGISRVHLQQTLKAVAALELIPIKRDNEKMERAAIGELLDGELLQSILKGEKGMHINNNQTFNHLRKRAILNGFIPES